MLFDASLLRKQCRMLWEPALLDRTGHFHSLDNITVLQPWQQPDPSLDFNSLCQQRVQDIINLDKKINLLWSGGADSTLVLLLLRQQGIDPGQLCVLGSTDSMNTNPALSKNRLQHV